MANKSVQSELAELMKVHKFCAYCGGSLVLRLIDAEQRIACSSRDCGYVLWNNPVPVVAVLVEHVDRDDQQGSFVLARNVAWSKKRYSVITGFIEASDRSTYAAAKREVREELNLHALCYHYIGHYTSIAKNQILFAYQVKASGLITLNAELSDYKYYPFEQLTASSSETGQSIADFIAQRKAGLLKYCNYD